MNEKVVVDDAIDLYCRMDEKVLIELIEDEIFNTPQKKRCRDCVYLVEDKDGNWVCDESWEDIHKIPDEECSANKKW